VNFHRKIEKAQKKSKRMSGFPIPRTESTHHRLYEFAKSAIIKIFAHPYATVSNTNPSLSPHTHTRARAHTHTYLSDLDFLFSGVTREGMWFVLWRRSGHREMGRCSNHSLHWNRSVFLFSFIYRLINVLFFGILLTIMLMLMA